MTSLRGPSFASKLVLLGALAAFAPGCSSAGDALSGNFGGTGTPGSFGATPGGVQDMTFARDLVEAGQVPPPEALLVEAMFSEHDLPLSGPPCETLLCPRAAMGVAPDRDGETKAWMQVGLSSTIDPDAFQRPTLSLVAAVDVSGSMGWGGTETPADITRNLLQRIAAELEPNDRIAIVTYGGTVDVALPWTTGGSPNVDATIAALGTNGSTDMESGLLTAYSVAATAADTDETRVMLFTDVQPNVGATTATEFEQIVENGAEHGVGLTVFGTGLGLGAEVMNAMATVRGGNAFSTTEVQQVGELMANSWPWMVSPIAYDLTLTASPSPNLSLTDAYGFPGDSSALEVATVFLSKRRGALLLGFEPQLPLNAAEAEVTLGYTTPDGEAIELSVAAAYEGEELDERGAHFSQTSADKTVALALLVEGMHEAAEQYATSPQTAEDTMRSTLARFEKDANTTGEQPLLDELAFWTQLLELMEQRAPQGDLYGPR